MKHIVLSIGLLPLLTGSAVADGKQKAALELAEFAVQRFGSGVAKGGVQALATKIESAAARHGADIFTAVRKVGPRALPLVEQAGAHGKQAARILAHHGEAGAVWVVTRPSAMNLATRHGDRAAAVLVKHAGGVAEPVIGTFGAPAIRALEAVGPQSGRRMAMLAADGHLAKIGRTEELLEVVAKYGDRAAKFIWANKGSLAVGTTLAAFLLHPESFLDGVGNVTRAAGEAVVKPIAEPIAQGVGTGISVGVTAVFLLLGGGVILALGYGALRVKAIMAWWVKRPQKV